MITNILEVKLTDKQYAALSCETRRVILAAIYDTPMCPREIAKSLDITVALAKRHLRILLECRLVLQSLRGNIRIYQSNQNLLSF